jgi:hypothetical protein
MIIKPSYDDFLFVCEHMRPQSRDEVFGLFPGGPEDLARYLVRSNGFHWAGVWDGVPCAMIGAYPIRHGVWGLYGFGTDLWRKAWRAVTIAAKRDMFREVSGAGAHRAECMTLADHEETHRWLMFLGATHRAEMPMAGRNGEDYVMFSWLKEKV